MQKQNNFDWKPSVGKSIELKKISNTLGKPLPVVVQSIMDAFDEKDKALDDLYSLSKNFKYTKQRLEEYKISPGQFKDICHSLNEAGAGQWIKGHFVSASSLAFGSTLEYILKEMKKRKINWPEIAFNLIDYFDKEKTGKIA